MIYKTIAGGVFVVAILIGMGIFFTMQSGEMMLPEEPSNGKNDMPPSPSPSPSPEPTPEPSPSPSPTSTPTPPPNSTPPPVGSASLISRIPTQENVVVLTFDAGADRGFAAQILDTLRDEDVLATFGMTGHWAEQNPDLIERIANEGHDFINHTWSHRSFTGFSTGTAPLTQAERWEELNQTEQIIQDIAQETMQPYFRPPYGDYNASVNRDIFLQGYRFTVMWTVDSFGWRGLTAQEIRERVVGGTVPGAIHLLHVGEQSQDAAALPLIIEDLRAQGYSFARISDVLQ